MDNVQTSRDARPVAMGYAETEARIDAHFGALDTIIARIRAQMVADGLIREPGSRTRAGDAK